MKDYQRVKYNNSPLVEVVFQLRFPTILSINSEAPSSFQDLIRSDFPYFTERFEPGNEVSIEPDGRFQIRMNDIKNYSFVSKDSKYKVNLTSSFISLSTLEYTQWEEFFAHIQTIVPIFEKVYAPSFYIRTGLRYVDVFTRSKVSLEGCPWNELLEPNILGILSPEIEEGSSRYVQEAEFANPDNTRTQTHFELVHVNNEDELSFLFDCDYYTNNIVECGEVFDVANQLHTNSSMFICKSITKKLHEAMDPEEI